VFIGSSSIKIWKSLKNDFAGYPVINRGFGGSHFSDAIYYFEDIVAPYKPSKIIIYEGDNDLASEKSISEIFSDFKEFHKLIKKNLNDPEIAVISAKPSPKRWHLKNEYEALNLKFETYCGKKKNMTYIDVYNPMLTDTGRPDPELFQEDSLHMNPKGYKVWTNLILPFIEK
jgi:lysophospholipase L1-like esterase